MKNIILFLLFIITASKLSAGCVGDIRIFPNNKEISINSIFFIEGELDNQIIDSINIKYNVYLRLDSQKIKLQVIDFIKGQFNFSQVILKPEIPLKTGRKYYLEIDSLTEYQKEYYLSRYNIKTYLREPICWTVTNYEDNLNPQWLILPSILDLFVDERSVFVNFNSKIKDQSEILIKVELIELESNKNILFYLYNNTNENIKVGHYWCASIFHYSLNKKYKIHFLLSDFSGNKNENYTDWVIFDSPKKN